MSFLAEREDWLRVETVDRPGGGWDVVLVIDGTYFTEEFATKADMIGFFERWIRDELRGGKR